MKSLVRLLVAAFAFCAATQASLAQTATQNINLNATVADYCTIAGSATGGLQTRTITVNTGIVDTAALSQVTVASVVCSKASDVTLTSTNTGLTGPTAPSGSFQDVIHYTAVASYGGASPSIDTSSSNTDTDATSGAASGTLTVDITPQANALPMTTGGYADVLVVTLTPQP